MRRKNLSSSSSRGGAELFICFTSRPSTTTSSAAPPVPPPPAAAPLLSTSLSRRGGRSLKGGQSPMFPSTTSTGRRKGAAFEAVEPSSPKVTCIGQVRVKGGKRKKQHHHQQQQQQQSGLALRSRSRRAVAAAESSFRKMENYERECKSHNSQGGWVYQIPVGICDALKTFGSELNCLLPCGGNGKSVCGNSRNVGDYDQKGKKRRRKATGSWLCGATLARWLMSIEDEDVGVEDGKVVDELDEGEVRKVGLVMEGWELEKEVEEKDEILVVGGKEEGRVSVCIPPSNALLLMRCRSDPVRMAALATRFWGSPAGLPEAKGQVEDEEENEEEEEEEEEGKVMKEVECDREKKSQEVADCEGDEMLQDLGRQEDCAAAATVMEADGKDMKGEEVALYDHGEEEKMAAKQKEEGEEEKEKGDEEGEIAKKDGILDIALAQEGGSEAKMVQDKAEVVTELKEEAEKAKGGEKEQEEVKWGRSNSCSPLTAREEQKLSRSGSRRHCGYSVGRQKVSRRHSFSTESDARRPSFSNLKDARRASFSIDKDGKRWSFSIEQEHLIAEPKIVMRTNKNKKCSRPELEQEKGGGGDDDVVVLELPNSEEDISQVEAATQDQGKEEEAGRHSLEVETVEEEKKEEKEEGVGGEEKVEEKQEKKKRSGELPDSLLLMMYEPKLSMEVSKETWVCSTDFVHWQAHRGQSHHNRRLTKAASAADGAKAKDNTEGNSDKKVAQESNASESVNSAPKMPKVLQMPKAPTTVEQKLKVEVPVVTAAAYAPFVLKRCKSEPMRSSARLAPDAYFWQDRHRPIGATGIGF